MFSLPAGHEKTIVVYRAIRTLLHLQHHTRDWVLFKNIRVEINVIVLLETQFLSVRFFFYVALRPAAGQDLLIFEVSRSHTTMHLSR